MSTDLLEKKVTLEQELNEILKKIEEETRERGHRAQHVELYQGGLGVTPEFVIGHQRPVGQLRWRDDVKKNFAGRHDDPGDVSGEPWGSGALLFDNLFLTSGHCFDQVGNARRRPSRNNRTIRPDEIARLMSVTFSFQKAPDGGMRDPVTFPVLGLVEYRERDVDFAIVELGPDKGRMPNDLFGYLPVARRDATPNGARLCIIQHPHGREKVVDTGRVVRNDGGVIAYIDVETNGGSSGAPILFPCDNSRPAEIVGIHQRGGCAKFSGSSMGISIGAIRRVSRVLS